MKVEIWSDIACPFCYIGKRRFEAALEQFANRDHVEVIFRSFELDPSAKRDVEYDVHSMLSAKYGMSREQAVAMNANVASQAQAVGLSFHPDTIVLTNTFDAHRLTHYAAQSGRMKEMAERLFKAYFTDSLHIGDHGTLAALAGEVGLDEAEALRMLSGDEYSDKVRSDEEEAAKLGIRAVPFFVIDRKYGVSGAQSAQVFQDALGKAWGESKPLAILNDGGDDPADDACADGACKI